MPIGNITTNIISTLGNKESLIPIMIKDGVDSGSLTYHSYKAGGKIEGTDRAIDEFGTQAIWIGGIPFYKKLIDATIYKNADFHPGVDTRVISDKEYAEWAKTNAKGIMPNDGFLKSVDFLQPKEETVKSAMDKALKDGGIKTKKLYAAKVAASTALTLATFFALTKFKQKNTENAVKNEIKLENKQPLFMSFTGKEKKSVFDDIADFSTKHTNKPSFKGLNDIKEAVMFNPVHNMQIIDAGITAERVGCSRNKTEFMEHTIKEGGFLFFLYCFGDIIENQINKFSSNKLGTPVDVDIDVIMDKKLTEALKKGTIKEDVEKLPKEGSLTDKLNFIVENPDNIFVRAAKKSKIVSETTDETGNMVVDTSKYIDMKKFEKLGENLKTIEEKYTAKGGSAEHFVNKMKGMKIASVGANMALSCAFLGYLIPKAVYKYRKEKTGTDSYHVTNDIKNNNKA